MSDNIKDEMDRLSRGNKVCKVLRVVSVVFLVLSVGTLFTETYTVDVDGGNEYSGRPWKLAGIFFLLSLVSSYIAYRLVGGRNNPTLYQDKKFTDN